MKIATAKVCHTFVVYYTKGRHVQGMLDETDPVMYVKSCEDYDGRVSTLVILSGHHNHCS